MTRKERLFRTFQGQSVDRPAVSFYEIDGFNQNPDDPDEYNIFNDPSWQPLLSLAREKSDVIATTSCADIIDEGKSVNFIPNEYVESKVEDDGNCLTTTKTVRCGTKILTQKTVREKDIDTLWVTEHLLKDNDDLRAWLDLPMPDLTGEVYMDKAIELEERIGDAGCIMLDTKDPLIMLAELFDMTDYTIIAMTEPNLFKRALDKIALYLEWKVELIARAFPGRLWRIYGPEYASPPYLPPTLFKRYVTEYDKRLVDIIHSSGGYGRLHSHGNLKDILDHITDTGCMGIDPIEPPPQGDVELSYVRENYGKDLVLFGNLEASDLVNLAENKFREKIKKAISEGTAGDGRGFVLLPSACPYGRKLPLTAMKNYEAMIDEIEKL